MRTYYMYPWSIRVYFRANFKFFTPELYKFPRFHVMEDLWKKSIGWYKKNKDHENKTESKGMQK